MLHTLPFHHHPTSHDYVRVDADIPRLTDLDGAGKAAQWRNIVTQLGPLEIVPTRSPTRAGNGKHDAGAFGLVIDGLDAYYEQFAESRVKLPENSSDLTGLAPKWDPFETVPTALFERPVGCPGRTVHALSKIVTAGGQYDPGVVKLVDCGHAPPVMEAPSHGRAVIAASQVFYKPGALSRSREYQTQCPAVDSVMDEGVDDVVDGADYLISALERVLDIDVTRYEGRDGNTHQFRTADGDTVPFTGDELLTASGMTEDIQGLTGTHTVSAVCGSEEVTRSVEIDPSDLRYTYGDESFLKLGTAGTTIGAALRTRDPTRLTCTEKEFRLDIEYLILRDDVQEDDLGRTFEFETVTESISTFADAGLPRRRAFQ